MRKYLALAAAAALALLAVGPAAAQSSSVYGKVQQPWSQQGKISGGVSVTTTSAATALPPAGLSAWICNTGAVDAYVAFGTANTVAATVNGSSWLKSSTCGTYDLFPYFNGGASTFLAAITASGSTTLAVETGIGSGPGQGSGGGGGGGGGAITAAPGAFSAGAGSDGWDVTEGTKADAAYTGTGSASVVSILKGIYANGGGGGGGGNVNITQILGAAPSATNPLWIQPGTGASFAVTNAGTFAVQLTGTTNNINNIAGTISLPTGAATSALQTTGNTSLATIATNSGTQATAALQTTGNTSLSTIATNSASQATAANQTAEQAPVAYGTATATKSVLGGAEYLSTQPTATTGQQGSLLSSSRGELLVAPGVSGFPVTLTSTTITGTVTTSGTVSQATAASLNATVVPSSVSAWGLTPSTQNSATPTNSQLVNCQYNTSPTTITSGNTSPVQCNNAGALNVNIVAGGGSGGTASSYGATFPATGTAAGGLYQSTTPSYTSGNMVPFWTTVTGSLHTTIDNAVTPGAAAVSTSSPVTPSNKPVGATNFATAQVSVTTTATSILAARTGVSGTGRISATVCNTTTTAIYLGGSGVTASTGQLLAGVVGACATFDTQTAIYGIVASGTATVGASETY